MNTPRPLAIKHYGPEHTGDTINVVWESDHNMHQVKETVTNTANVKQTVQSVSVDVLGSTALVSQDVYAKPSLRQNPHSATDNCPCRDCCPDTDITPGAHCIPTSEEESLSESEGNCIHP